MQMLRNMASWQFVVQCAVLLGVAAYAQESTLSAATVANNPGSAFVYVPSTTVEGAIAVMLSSCSSSGSSRFSTLRPMHAELIVSSIAQ